MSYTLTVAEHMSYTLTVATLPKLCETGQQGREAKKAQAANCCVRVITDKSPPQATSGLWTKFKLQLIKAKKKIKDKESNHLEEHAPDLRDEYLLQLPFNFFDQCLC